jgi:hypothetical protein
MFHKSIPLKSFLATILISFLFSFSLLIAQKSEQKSNVFVDDAGVMRWEETKKEVYGFGVNYTVPFAHAYRSAKRLGIDPKKAIDNDVYHFSRMGFDLYRLHVWDTEISDTLGNLIANENLETFDYLLKELTDKGFKIVLTPIAFWGNGWPEPDENTPGFSHKYGKGDCLTNPDAIKAQQNYLFQFLNHVNPYTGIAYKDDPNVIAFEVSNEPHHRGEANVVAEFVKGMVDAMKKTGTKKPIFYNVSHGVHFMDAYFEAGIQGGTFQWYPTGLGYQRELSGNLLPNVNDYNIPFDETIKKHKGAKLVYEFDAADVAKSYIYPAMARSFRGAGIQIATHFAYDPTYLAYANTEYNTHYMNLAYTPKKALSLMICSEIFHQVPMYADYGVYPKNRTFDKFRVDYQKDLAEYNSPEKFIYTNHTATKPVDESQLNSVAGFGNSALVQYDGLGVYFIDKIEEGIWRLEVMPDAVSVDNPFGRNSPDKTVSVINWESHNMKIKLADLGSAFELEAINEGNTFSKSITDASFSIAPGTYMLTKKGKAKSWSPNDKWKHNQLKDFYAPETTVTKPWFKHIPKKEVSQNKTLTIDVQFIAPNKPESIKLTGWYNGKTINVDMTHTGGYAYSATIPSETLTPGFLNYNIIVKQKEDSFLTYPAAKEGHLWSWDFYDRSTYKVRVVPGANPIHLFSASTDVEVLVRQWRRAFRLVPLENDGEAEYQMNIENLFRPDNENLNATPVYDYSFKHFIIDRIAGRKADLANKKQLIFKGRALNDKPCKLQIAFVMNDGQAYGKIIAVGNEAGDYKIELKDLKPVKTVTLPRPYPSFLPYYFAHELTTGFDINRVESIQFSIGPGIPESEREEKHGVGVVSLRLE